MAVMVLPEQGDVIRDVVDNFEFVDEDFEDEVLVAKQEQALLRVDAMTPNSVRNRRGLTTATGSRV